MRIHSDRDVVAPSRRSVPERAVSDCLASLPLRLVRMWSGRAEE